MSDLASQIKIAIFVDRLHHTIAIMKHIQLLIILLLFPLYTQALEVSNTELYFTKVLWPDLKPHHIDEAIRDFYARKRNFGGH